MSRYKKFSFLIIIVEMILVLFCNVMYLHGNSSGMGRLYRAEAKRIARDIEEQNLTGEDIAQRKVTKHFFV